MTRILILAVLLLSSWPALALDKLRLGYPAAMNGQVITTLDKAGLAPRHGLEIEYSYFQNGPPMMEAFAAGQLDVAVTSLMPLATFAGRLPGQAVIVANLGNSSYAVLVRDATPYGGLADLKGKKIAVSFGSDSHLDLLLSLAAEGIDPATGVELQNIQPAELPVALEKNFSDAVVIRQPQVLRLQSQGARLIKAWPHRFVVLARAGLAEQHPEVIRRLVAALGDATAFIAANPDQSAAWFGEKMRIDPAVVKQVSLENPLISNPASADLGVTPELRATTESWMAAALKWGLIKTPVESAKLFAP